MHAKERALDIKSSTAIWRKRILVLFAALMLFASTAFGMSQPALAAPADGDETTTGEAGSVDPSTVGSVPPSALATLAPEAAAPEPAAETTPAAEPAALQEDPTLQAPAEEAIPEVPVLLSPESIAAEPEAAAPLASDALLASGQYVPRCEAGYVYGITNAGQIRQVAANGDVTNIGNPAGQEWKGRYPVDNNFNGLGIGTGGSPVFAYNRAGANGTDSNVRIYSFDTTTGTWVDTNVNADSSAGGAEVTFVAGAVNLDTGKYFLGGYVGTGDNRVFRLWQYDPVTKSVTYKGQVKAPGSGAANGDIAFDANGNLFVVRGAGSTTTIYSVTAANLQAANGGTIPSSASK